MPFNGAIFLTILTKILELKTKICLNILAVTQVADIYNPYQKAGGGQVSDTEYEAVMKAEKSGKKTMIDSTKKEKTEKKYPSGLSDTDIDKIINSKEVREGMTHFEDKKRGGKVGK